MARASQPAPPLPEIYEELTKAADIKDRAWLGKTYKSCVDAREVVSWLVEQPYCASRSAAVDIGLELQKQGKLVHVWGSKRVRFSDHKLYFRFDCGLCGDTQVDATPADTHDLVVLGGGTAGMSAAITALQLGVERVLLVEASKVGGDCTWTGCVPSKSLIAAAHTVHAGRVAAKQFGVGGGGGGDAGSAADLGKVRAHVQRKVEQVAAHDMSVLEDKKVPLLHGRASFRDANTLEVTPQDGGAAQAIKARSFVLAVGAAPHLPPIEGLAGVPYHTYETIWGVGELPKRMCVVGGGVIGCELAQAFARLGASVTLVASRLLPKEPPKVDALLAAQFAEEGVALLRGRGARAARVDAEGKVVRLGVVLADQSALDVECELLLLATGRRPSTAGLGLDKAGVALDPKSKLIAVSPALQTSAAHIYAAGDCCTLQQFTHYALLMGGWAARNLLVPGSVTPTEVVPRCTFTSPEVASVGLTEEEARAQGCEVVSQPIDRNERAVCEDDTRGFLDVYLDKKDGVVGACVVNQRAGECLSEILVAMEHRLKFTALGLTKVVHPYPAYSWAVSMLATDVNSKRFDSSTAGKVARWLVRNV